MTRNRDWQMLGFVTQPLLLNVLLPCRVGKSPGPAAEHIFLINCLAAIRSVLEDQDCCQSKHLVLTKDIQQHLMQLVDENATRILQSCGFKAQLEHDRYGCINATG